ncbi:hypothetical protein [Streptomyces tremellae]|uniref:Uncharacterized protein n=1 Tax=Streptomyces tremellae TaxID=1124239 RepID=A0ABP7FF19_9ACTN
MYAIRCRGRAGDAPSRPYAPATGYATLLCCRRHVDLCRVASAVCRRAVD